MKKIFPLFVMLTLAACTSSPKVDPASITDRVQFERDYEECRQQANDETEQDRKTKSTAISLSLDAALLLIPGLASSAGDIASAAFSAGGNTVDAAGGRNRYVEKHDVNFSRCLTMRGYDV